MIKNQKDGNENDMKDIQLHFIMILVEYLNKMIGFIQYSIR